MFLVEPFICHCCLYLLVSGNAYNVSKHSNSTINVTSSIYCLKNMVFRAFMLRFVTMYGVVPLRNRRGRGKTEGEGVKGREKEGKGGERNRVEKHLC